MFEFIAILIVAGSVLPWIVGIIHIAIKNYLDKRTYRAYQAELGKRHKPLKLVTRKRRMNKSLNGKFVKMYTGRRRHN